MAAPDPARALCYHALLAAAHAAGVALRGRCAREWALAPGLARMVTHARDTVAFVAALADARDAVTGRPLVTDHVVSPAHGACCLLQDAIVAWLNAPGGAARGWASAAGVLHESHVMVEPPVGDLLSARDVFAFGVPLVGAFALGEALPVCTDAPAAQLFKKVTLLLYVTQYDQELHEEALNVEAFVEGAVRAGAPWWEGVCAIACPMLWVCLRLDLPALMHMCACIQSDSQTWRKEALAPAYALAGVERMGGAVPPENVETQYVVAALTDHVDRMHRGQKVMNPTAAQCLPYMHLMMAKMRLLRNKRGTSVTEDVYPKWTTAGQIAPYTLAEAAAVGVGRGLVVQDATRQHSFAAGLAADGSGFCAHGDMGEVVVWRANSPPAFDALPCVGTGFWRAHVVEHVVGEAQALRIAHLRALLASEDLRVAWVEAPRTEPEMTATGAI